MRQASRAASHLQKICATCGRQISWRKKWEKNWESITFCSDSCRKNKIRPNSLDLMFESKILALLNQRRLTHGIAAAVVTCEEAEEEAVKEELDKKALAKANAHDDADDDTENLQLSKDKPGEKGVEEQKKPDRTRERCRQAARRLAARGEIVVTQDGKITDPSFAKGVMELKLPR